MRQTYLMVQGDLSIFVPSKCKCICRRNAGLRIICTCDYSLMPTVPIIGANRGLGLAFVKSYVAKGWDVIACVRDVNTLPKIENVRVFKLDVGSLTDAKVVAGEVLALGIKLDVVLHIAAQSLDPSPLAETPAAILDLSYETNTRGPLLVFQAMKPHLMPGGKFAVISSILGSISCVRRGGKGAYGMTFAARNYMVRKLQVENPAFVIMALDPGHLDTHMGRRGAAWYNSTSVGSDVNEVAPALIEIIEGGTQDTVGGWQTDWKGERVPC